MRGEGREKDRERNINPLPLTPPQPGTWPATQSCAQTGNQNGDFCDDAQPTELHGSGLNNRSLRDEWYWWEMFFWCYKAVTSMKLDIPVSFIVLVLVGGGVNLSESGNALKASKQPCPVWLSRLGVVPQRERSQVRSPVSARLSCRLGP